MPKEQIIALVAIASVPMLTRMLKKMVNGLRVGFSFKLSLSVESKSPESKIS